MSPNKIPSYRVLLDDATKTLYDNSESPRIDAEVLMQHVIERPLAWLIAHGETIASTDHTNAFYDLVKLRHAGHPIAYLTGHKNFWNLSLKVDSHVLIPRPDTETLVEKALERLPKDSDLDVLDLGTGSGAIALSIAKERPNAKVLAVDSQTAALAIARENALSNDVNNALFLHSDWYSTLPQNQNFDLIVSNPPYVDSDDPHLQKGDLRFEPTVALTAQDKGLADLNIIIQTAPLFLKPRGWLLVEHGYNQAEDIANLFNQNDFCDIDCATDINDLPRCTMGRLV